MKNKLNCKDIDRLIYLTDDEMSPAERERAGLHLAECESCRIKRDEALHTRSLLIEGQKKIRIPEDPAAVIPPGIGKITGQPDREHGNPNGLMPKVARILQRASAVAAVLLLLLFLSEQALTINRISQLEHRIGNQPVYPAAGIFDQAYRIRMALGEKEWEDILTGLGIDVRSKILPAPVPVRQLLEKRMFSRVPFGARPPIVSGFVHPSTDPFVQFKNSLR